MQQKYCPDNHAARHPFYFLSVDIDIERRGDLFLKEQEEKELISYLIHFPVDRIFSLQISFETVLMYLCDKGAKEEEEDEDV